MDERRKALGNMLMDVSKYMVTAIIIGGFFTEKSHSIHLGIAFFAAISVAAIAFFIIPDQKQTGT